MTHSKVCSPSHGWSAVVRTLSALFPAGLSVGKGRWETDGVARQLLSMETLNVTPKIGDKQENFHKGSKERVPSNHCAS